MINPTGSHSGNFRPADGGGAASRLVLVDDHTMFRRGLRQSLEEQGMDVIGEASNGKAGVQIVRELDPDIVLMDLHMPLMDGIEAVRRLGEAGARARILMLTISVEEEDIVEALVAGAAGYILKTASIHEVLQAIRALRDGDSAISPAVATRVVHRIRATVERQPHVAVAPEVLTVRERQILRLLAEGKENAQIGEVLFISPSTAKNHVASVLEKLGLENRVQAAVYAVRAGIV